MATLTQANTQSGVLVNRTSHSVVSLAARPALAHQENTVSGKPAADKRPTERPKTVVICDTQPVTAEGIRNLLAGSGDLQFALAAGTLNHAREWARLHSPDVLVIDKAFGIQAILDFFKDASDASRGLRSNVVIWGVSLTEAEALRFLQAGARGLIRKTAPVPAVLACLRSVAEGRTWMEDSVFRDGLRSDRYPRTELTAREQQVLELVEQGFKNKDIANELGIRPGTVKIHLKHIFEKTGIRGRYGLALSGLRERGLVTATA
jgi:two-component system nitrate/nitrite response regulator NarL